MSSGPRSASASTAEWHNRLAERIVAQVLDEPIVGGGTMSDVLLLLESVMVGVVGNAFPPHSVVQGLEAVTARATERLARLQTGGASSVNARRANSKLSS